MSASTPNIPGYELIRELGSGGMAVVWLAIQRSLDRKIAIKVMKRNIDDLEKFERRFLVEGRTMAKLPHRNIVAVYDIVKSDENTYIAMEYLQGDTLSQKMKEGLSLAEGISVVVQIAQALQFAHEHGVVHRDLKPANIMFRDDATPVLTDFGIARQQDSGATRLTQTGMLVGTPTYMSPEQINALEVDGRSDLYSLGILFYELLTGAPPFQADTPIAVLMAHLTSPPPTLPPQFADFQPVLDGMLAKSRDDRFPDLRVFTRALKGAVQQNHNLWARLQSDPNQSSSEQLRALGFSISGPSSQSIAQPDSGQIRLPPSSRGLPRTPTPGPASLQFPDQFTQPSVAPRRPPWALIGGAAAAAVLVVVLLIAFWPRTTTIDPGLKALVDTTLIGVREQIAKKDLAKARELLIPAMQQAGSYEGTLKVVDEMAEALKAQTEAALAARDYDAATVGLEQVRALKPEDPALTAIETRIKAGRARAAQGAEIAALLARADEAIKARRDLGASGAYAILAKARQLAPDDANVKQRVDALVARVLDPARAALGRNELDVALKSVRTTEGELANEPAWKTLEAEVERATNTQALRLRVATVLQQLDQQLQRGRLLEPAGDNARESLAAAQKLDAASPEVAKRQTALAQALTASAKQSLDRGETEKALTDANAALAVQPAFAEAATLKRTAEGRLDASRAKVLETLDAARQALAEQRFLPPAQPNARALVEQVLGLDPQNAEAQSLLAELPRRIVAASRARAQSGDIEGALALANEARKVYLGDTELAALADSLAKQLVEAQAQRKRAEQLERIAQLTDARPLKPANVGNAAKGIAALLAADARDVDAATARQKLFASLTEALTAAQSPADTENIEAALQQAQQSFPNDPASTQLAAALTSTRARLVAEEQARLAALSGDLVLNAYPWATVVSVVDAQGKAQKLPADATTPLTLSVPQGVYKVTFRHPQAGGASETARVQAKKSVLATTSFAGRVTAKGYLQRAGW